MILTNTPDYCQRRKLLSMQWLLLIHRITTNSDYCQHQNDTNEEILPPNNLLIPGAPKTHPRKNVDQLHDKIKIHGSGAPRIKKQYRCSICHA